MLTYYSHHSNVHRADKRDLSPSSWKAIVRRCSVIYPPDMHFPNVRTLSERLHCSEPTSLSHVHPPASFLPSTWTRRASILAYLRLDATLLTKTLYLLHCLLIARGAGSSSRSWKGAHEYRSHVEPSGHCPRSRSSVDQVLDGLRSSWCVSAGIHPHRVIVAVDWTLAAVSLVAATHGHVRAVPRHSYAHSSGASMLFR